MFCPNCGKSNLDGVKFCNECGVKIATETLHNTYTSQQTQHTEYQSTETSNQNVHQNNVPPYFQEKTAQNAQPVYQQQTKASNNMPGKGFGIASLVLGIVSIALFYEWFLAIPCGILGIVFGCIASGKAKQCGMKNSMSTAGIVCSSIGLGLVLLFVLLIAGIVSLVTSTISDIPFELFANGILEII